MAVLLFVKPPAPAGIPVATSNIIVNGGNAGSPNLTLSRTDTSIPLCNSGGDSYTFNAKWQGLAANVWNTPNGSGFVELGIATRKLNGGSGSNFIAFNNCAGGTTTQAVSPTWALFVYSEDEYGNVGSTLATNPSQDFNNIPTTGWVIYQDLTSITITAAPAGFPYVASTNQIRVTSVTGTLFGVANNGIGTYTKNGVFNGAAGGFVQYAFDLDGNALICCTSQIGGDWRLYGYNGDNTDEYSVNTSSNSAIIPTTGWSPAITITAA